MRNLIVVFFCVELIPSVYADWRSLVFIVADSYGNERSKECSNFRLVDHLGWTSDMNDSDK